MPEVFERGAAVLADVNETLLYQAPNSDNRDRAIILSCTAANSDPATPVGITIKVTTSGGSLIYRGAVEIPVSPKATLELMPNRKVLKRGDRVTAQATLGGRLEVAIDVLQITPNV